MVRVTIKGQRFGLLVGDNATDVFFHLLTVFFGNKTLPIFNRKDDLYQYLGVGISHAFVVSPLGAWVCVVFALYKGFVPTGLPQAPGSFPTKVITSLHLVVKMRPHLYL